MNIIVDIDGTIADCRHRRHFVIDGQHDWKSFFESMVEDKPIKPIVSIIKELFSQNNIYLTTGRPSQYRPHTEDWLLKYEIPYNYLYMRREHDYREDSIVKQEMLDDIRKEHGEVHLAIDDREPVVQMWRKNGIVCLQNSMRELP